MALKVATSLAFRETLKHAKSRLLEPFFDLEITTPEDYMGSIISDLNSRRGKVLEMNPFKGLQVIRAEAPLAKLFGYATALRSLSQGRATFTMKFKNYSPTPLKEEKEILHKLGR